MKPKNSLTSDRRGFLGALAAGAATLGFLGITSPLKAAGNKISEKLHSPGDPDQIFKNLKGKNRAVFDVPQPHGIFPFAWPRVFLMTNIATGTPEKENDVIVILRHDAIPYAFEDKLWAKYNFGEVFKAEDPVKKLPASTRNPFWQAKKSDFSVPGIGEISIAINELQESGVIFMVCDAAITVYSAAVAQRMGTDAAAVKQDWLSGLLPGIHRVPSGIWALSRAQKHGCAYIFAG